MAFLPSKSEAGFRKARGRKSLFSPSMEVSFTRREPLSWCCRCHSLWALVSFHRDSKVAVEPKPHEHISTWKILTWALRKVCSFIISTFIFVLFPLSPKLHGHKKTMRVPLLLSHSLCSHQVDYRPRGLKNFASGLPEACMLVTKDRIWPGAGFWVTWHQN